jgi:hypothetical protein
MLTKFGRWSKISGTYVLQNCEAALTYFWKVKLLMPRYCFNIVIVVCWILVYVIILFWVPCFWVSAVAAVMLRLLFPWTTATFLDNCFHLMFDVCTSEIARVSAHVRLKSINHHLLAATETAICVQKVKSCDRSSESVVLTLLGHTWPAVLWLVVSIFHYSFSKRP